MAQRDSEPRLAVPTSPWKAEPSQGRDKCCVHPKHRPKPLTRAHNIYTQARMHTHTCIHTHTYTRTHTHTRVHTRIHTYTHTYTQELKLLRGRGGFGHRTYYWTLRPDGELRLGQAGPGRLRGPSPLTLAQLSPAESPAESQRVRDPNHLHRLQKHPAAGWPEPRYPTGSDNTAHLPLPKRRVTVTEQCPL